MVAIVFVQKIGHLLCKEAQLHVPLEAPHVSVDGLLPLECSPANAVSVILPLRLARAQIFALTALATHLTGASPSHSCG